MLVARPPMKVLTAAQMREVDRRTIELGIPGIVLMENAGHRVVEFLAREVRAARRAADRDSVRQGQQRRRRPGGGAAAVHALPSAALDVVLLAAAGGIEGRRRAESIACSQACGCPVAREIHARMRERHDWWWMRCSAPASTVRRRAACWRRSAPSTADFRWPRWWRWIFRRGCRAIRGDPVGERRAPTITVTFTAPKVAQALAPNCDAWASCAWRRSAARRRCSRTTIPSGSRWSQPAMFAGCSRRARAIRAHKGSYGHVLVVAGSHGKTGAAAMSGMAALRAGAGLVTVASAESAIPVIAAHAPELMTEALDPARLSTEFGARRRRRARDRAGPGHGCSATVGHGARRVRRIRAADGGRCRRA